MFIYGGLAGILSSVFYSLLFTVPVEYAGFPVVASQLQIVIYFWAGPLMAVFGILNSYAIYRILATERQGSMNRLAYLFSIIAFSFVTIMIMIQEAVRITISQRYLGAIDSIKQELYHTIYLSLDGVDLGIDLAWDLFLGLAIILTGIVMLGHSRFKAWFGIPSIFCGVLLLTLNAITAPIPPDAKGLFDAGPLVGLYALILSVYMIGIGIKTRKA
jgi:hypothetical protein